MLRTLIILFVYEIAIISLNQCHYSDCPAFKTKTSNSNETIFVKTTQSNSNVVVKTFLTSFDKNQIFGRAVLINNAFEVLEVLQADNDPKGCFKGLRSRPSSTAAKTENCELVVNAGLFDTHSGECYGNAINNGQVFLNSGGIKNAHFGVKNDGSLFFGYLSKEEVMKNQFKSLIGGAVWLLRNGNSVVNNSIFEECSDVQETGSLEDFAKVTSARSAIGAFPNGTIVIIQVSGRTRETGVNLFDLAKLMANMGIVAAINLDGGGSSTMVINGTLVSFPSDQCERLFTCERKVTTVLCVRARCPLKCPAGYLCVHGFCQPSSQLRTFISIIMVLSTVLVVLVVGFLLYRIIAHFRRKQSLKSINLGYNHKTKLPADDRQALLDDFEQADEL